MITQLLLALSILFTGLFAGIGFANLLGYIPAFKRMKQPHAFAMWQAVDLYFRARMPFVGVPLQLILLLTAISLYHHKTAFVLVALSLLLSIAELLVIMKKNLPLNIRIQEAGDTMPADFETMRRRAIGLFNLRAVMDLVAFVLVIAAWIAFSRYQ